MNIQDSQIDRLATERLLDRVIKIVCTRNPDAKACLSSEMGRNALRQQYGKAVNYGLTSELSAARYLITAWLLGPDFDSRFPAMHEVLNDSSLDSTRKGETIERFAVTLLEMLEAGRH